MRRIRNKKKHSRTSPDPQFKEFSVTKNKKLEIEWTMNRLGKPFRKQSVQKLIKTVKIIIKMPYMDKKPLARASDFFLKHHFLTLL